jgi:hypothetical protein
MNTVNEMQMTEMATQGSFPRESNAMSDWVTVAKADEIKFGDFRVAEVDGVYTK